MDNTPTERPLDPTPPQSPGHSVSAPDVPTDPPTGRDQPDDEDVTGQAGAVEPPD